MRTVNKDALFPIEGSVTHGLGETKVHLLTVWGGPNRASGVANATLS